MKNLFISILLAITLGGCASTQVKNTKAQIAQDLNSILQNSDCGCSLLKDYVATKLGQ